MSLWNPFTFTRGGAPAQLGATPPALRVVGGPATATQLAAARMAFNRFCGVVRTSPVPNPSEIGSLADGTRYQITVVGPSATMTIWPGANDSPYKSAIGVQEGGRWWLLVPPGGYLRPTDGKWTTEPVADALGGVGYVYQPNGRNYFVESPQGVSRGNIHLAAPIFSQAAGHHLGPLSSPRNKISAPFLAAGRLWQASSDATNLLLHSREAGTKVGQSLKQHSFPLPAAGAAGEWGLTTCTHDGRQIMICRASLEDFSGWATVGRVRLEFTPPATLQVLDSKNLPPQVSVRSPQGPEGEAPQSADWKFDMDEGTTTRSWTYTIPYPPLRPEDPPYTDDLVRTFEGSVSHHNKVYTQDSEYEAEGTLRVYLTPLGSEIADGVSQKHLTKIRLSVNQEMGGHNDETFANNFSTYEKRASVELRREFAVVLRSPALDDADVVVNMLEADYLESLDVVNHYTSSFGGWVVGVAGNVEGYWVQTSASISPRILDRRLDVKKTLNRILMHDAQFGTTATVKLEATYSRHTRVGWSGGSSTSSQSMSQAEEDRHNFFVAEALNYGGSGRPASEYLTYTDVLDEELELKVWLTLTGEEDIELTLPPGSRDAVEDAMRKLFLGCSQILLGPPPGQLDKTEGVRRDGVFGEAEVDESVEKLLDDSLGNAHYAKDPRTGAGFFAVRWGDQAFNRVVGPWGFSPISPTTTLSNSAVVTKVISV